ncbi:MAG: hypothetical protein KA817_11300 [Flavobacteriales bacterium]|nr:hypothetical protein [Flavobacteriales bacterium]
MRRASSIVAADSVGYGFDGRDGYSKCEEYWGSMLMFNKSFLDGPDRPLHVYLSDHPLSEFPFLKSSRNPIMPVSIAEKMRVFYYLDGPTDELRGEYALFDDPPIFPCVYIKNTQNFSHPTYRPKLSVYENYDTFLLALEDLKGEITTWLNDYGINDVNFSDKSYPRIPYVE